jgi:hypothetical protein
MTKRKDVCRCGERRVVAFVVRRPEAEDVTEYECWKCQAAVRVEQLDEVM